MQQNLTQVFEKWAQQTPAIRESILSMISQAKSGHPGGSLSLVEIIYTLFAEGGVMRINPDELEDPCRDRLVLSKGHGVPALYSILAHRGGYGIPVEELSTLRQLGSRLQGHPDRVRLPIVEASTGSLGQGASIAQGMAMAYRIDPKNDGRIFCIVGDGEIQEGQVWEVAMSSAHHKLSNLTLIIDYNKGQIDGPTDKVLGLEPLVDKWRAFGWQVEEIDGHYYSDLYRALSQRKTTRPLAVVAHTIKGRGVDFMEGKIEWHGKGPSDQELARALEQVRDSSTNKVGLSKRK